MSKRLKNVSGADQQIILKGKQLVLGKDSEMEMDDEVAEAFLKRCDGLVQEVVDIGGVYDTIKEDVIWVANMTGDPDISPTVSQKLLVAKGQWGFKDVENPLREPRTIRRTMGGEMKEVMGKSGLEGLNCFGVSIEVPPYKRRKLPRHIGNWFVQRSNYGTPGAIIKSRAPTDHEPTMKWELDDMRLFLLLIDPNVNGADLGPTMKKLKSQHDRKRVGKNDEELRRSIRQAKEMLMKRLHKRLADPKYRVPSEEEFAEFKAANVEAPEPSETAPAAPAAPENNLPA